MAGSGAAGMTAALTAAHHGLSVVVIEKAGSFGGSTARSGGGIWVPGNEVLRHAGVADTAGQARAYLAHVAARASRPDGGRRCSSTARRCWTSSGRRRRCAFAWVPGYADYYPEAPGGLAAGRSIEPVPLDGGGCSARSWPTSPPLPAAPPRDHHPGRLPLAQPRDLASAGRSRRGAGRGPDGAGQAAPAADAQHGAGAGRGPARRAADAGVPVWLDTPLTGLDVADGRVTGVARRPATGAAR